MATEQVVSALNNATAGQIHKVGTSSFNSNKVHEAKQFDATKLQNSLTKIKRETSNMEDQNFAVELFLQSSNNALYRMVGPTCRGKLVSIMDHPIVHFYIFLSIVVWFVLNMSNYVVMRSIYETVIPTTAWMPFMILWASSMNQKALIYIVRSFDFWIKVIYAIVLSVASMTNHFLFNIHSDEYLILSLVGDSCFWISIVAAVFLIGASDSVQTSRIWKIIASGSMAFSFLFWSVNRQFISTTAIEHDYAVVKISDNVTFSLVSLIVNAGRIVGIFFAKQSILFYKNKFKAASMSIKPTLKWDIEGNCKLDPEQLSNIVDNVGGVKEMPNHHLHAVTIKYKHDHEESISIPTYNN